MDNILSKLHENDLYQLSLEPTWFFDDSKSIVDTIFVSESFEDDNESLSETEAKKAFDEIVVCQREWFFFSYYDEKCLLNVAAKQFHPQNQMDTLGEKVDQILRQKQVEKTGLTSLDNDIDEQNFKETLQLMKDINNPIWAGYLASRVRKNNALHAVFYDCLSAMYFGKVFAELGNLDLEIQPKDFYDVFKKWEDSIPKAFITVDSLRDVENERVLCKEIVVNPMTNDFVENLYKIGFDYDYRKMLEDSNSTPELFLDILDKSTTKNSVVLTNETLKIWAKKKFPTSKLMEFALNDSREEVVVESFHLLTTYSNGQVADFFIQCIKDGPYRLAILAKKGLFCFSDRSLVITKLSELSNSNDEYHQKIGSLILEEIKNINSEPSKNDWAQLTDNSLMPERYTTAFFRHPNQLEQITREIKRMRKTDDNPVSILSIGASFGPEVYSVLSYLDDDFQKNPESWNNSSPIKSVNVYASDVDAWALIYTERGIFKYHPCVSYSDFGEEYRSNDNLRDLMSVGGKFDSNNKIYTIKPEMRARVKTRILNILNREDVDSFVKNNGNPNIVLYNYVDSWLERGHGAYYGAKNVLALGSPIVAASAILPEITYGAFQEQMNLVERKFNNSLFMLKDASRTQE